MVMKLAWLNPAHVGIETWEMGRGTRWERGDVVTR